MAENLKYDTTFLKGFVSEDDLGEIYPEVEKTHSLLLGKTGPGKEYLGWMDLPETISEELLDDIEKTANVLRTNSDAIVVIGIGGSYLGGKSAIETLAAKEDRDKIFFTGYNLSGDQLADLRDFLKERDFSVNVISKSGTTTEPAVAFRVLRTLLEEKYSASELKERVVCTTDSSKGALKKMADKAGYKCFVIPDDVGGRFSVLTPVGLLPAACAGIDIREMIEGAKEQRKKSSECDLASNPSYMYAAVRNILYRKGKRIEVFSSFDNRLHYVDEWWKQLYGESEGKGAHSIFPASCDFSTDLHSMGQLIQQGERNLFETFLVVEEEGTRCTIPKDRENADNLNYLAGRQLDYVSKKAYEATREAHFEGGVPNSTVFLPERSPFYLGQLFYFFEKAVAISAYLAGVNPFDQPGVEEYKQKMFRLLGKPGV